MSTPMATERLDGDLQGTPTNQTTYRRMIGGLMYLTASRPDITFATFVCALWYPKDSGFELIAYSDANHAGCKDDCKSTSRGLQFLGGKLVSWSSKKQDSTAMSIAEAEYVSLSACCAQVIWMLQHSKTKHIDIRYHFIKEHVKRGTVEIYFVGIEYQLAYLFTKALPKERFEYLVHRIVIIMAQQQHAADVHPDELCPPNKRYDLMDANKKVELEHVQCPSESKILMNIIKNHPLLADSAMRKLQQMYLGLYMAQFWQLKKRLEGERRVMGWNQPLLQKCKCILALFNNIHVDYVGVKCGKALLYASSRPATRIDPIPTITKIIIKSGRNKRTRFGMRIQHGLITDIEELIEHYKMYAEVFALDCSSNSGHSRAFYTRTSHDDAHPEGENSAKRQKTLEYEAYTDSYASDNDEIPTKQVTQDIIEEISLTIDEAKLKKMADEMLRQRCTSGDEHQYHIDQMKNFLQSDIPDYKNINKNDIEYMYLLIMNNKVPDYANIGLLWSLSVFIRSLVIWERVYDFQLEIESYQQKINLTAPIITFPGIEEYNVFSITLKYKKSYYNDVKYGYVQKELTNDEVEFLKLFEEEIEVRLNYRDQMRRWEMLSANARSSLMHLTTERHDQIDTDGFDLKSELDLQRITSLYIEKKISRDILTGTSIYWSALLSDNSTNEYSETEYGLYQSSTIECQ
ncbi:hypothetical protein Tco_0286990 [Tanacetum coccineum]